MIDQDVSTGLTLGGGMLIAVGISLLLWAALLWIAFH